MQRETHGAQQYTLSKVLTFDESELSKAVASEGTVGLLSRLLPRLRRAFPRARILVRLDGGFARRCLPGGAAAAGDGEEREPATAAVETNEYQAGTTRAAW